MADHHGGRGASLNDSPVALAANKDLFHAAEVKAFGTSVSSIWWRTEAVYVRDGQQSVHVTLDETGGALIYEPETGGWQICAWREASYLCRSSNSRGVWRPYVEPLIRR